MSKIDLKIITPEKLVYKEEVDEVYVPAQSGIVGILPKHSPLVSILKRGEVVIKKDGVNMYLAISGGILEIRPYSSKTNENSQVIVLADHAELAGEIDYARAEDAYAEHKRVFEERKEAQDPNIEYFESLMEKELNRVSVSKKRAQK